MSKKTAQTTTNENSSHKPNSQILKAYNAGIMPVSHRILFNAFKKALNGKTEGEINLVNLAEVLAEARVHRSSAMKSIQSMTEFKVIEFSTTYSSTPGKRGKWHTYIKLLNDPEREEVEPKSA